MKKNLLRIACMMLALLMLLPAVVSCSKKEEEKERETYANEFVGRAVSVLLEERVLYNGEKFMRGYTREYVPVLVGMDGDPANQIITVIPHTGTPAGELLAASDDICK